MRTQALLFTMMLGFTSAALAHGNVNERIHELDHEIEDHPNDVSLLIKRGQLYLDEGHADDALDDFIKATKLDPERIEALYHLAQAQLMLKQNDDAYQTAQKFIQHATNDAARVRGFVLTGGILSASNRPLEAADAYQSAITLSREIKPDHLLFAADAFHSAGKTEQAIAVLNDGIWKLGPLPALNDRALKLEMEQKRYESALRRIDKMLATQQRAPFLLYKKGIILKGMSRSDESKQIFTAALKEIDSLPASRKQTPALSNLRTSLLAEMN
jgi:tetratricopeptide (TPR) repeat protein